METEGQTTKVYVLTRPGLKDFLRRTSELYELAVYTASVPKYANPILDRIDPEKLISHRLFREHCAIAKGFFVKNLSRLGRSLKDVIIIDNIPLSYSLHPFNGIPVDTWISSKSDTQLKELLPILEQLAKVPDVRIAIKKIVKKGKVDYKNALQVLKNEVKMKKGLDQSFENETVNKSIEEQIKSEILLRHSNSQIALPNCLSPHSRTKSRTAMKEILSKSFCQDCSVLEEEAEEVLERSKESQAVVEDNDDIELLLEELDDSPRKKPRGDEPYRIPVRLASSGGSETPPEILPNFELSSPLTRRRRPVPKPGKDREGSKTAEVTPCKYSPSAAVKEPSLVATPCRNSDSRYSKLNRTYTQINYKDTVGSAKTDSYSTPLKTAQYHSERYGVYKKPLPTLDYSYGTPTRLNSFAENPTHAGNYKDPSVHKTHTYATLSHYTPGKETQLHLPGRDWNSVGMYRHTVQEERPREYGKCRANDSDVLNRTVGSVYGGGFSVRPKADYSSYYSRNTFATPKYETDSRLASKGQVSTPVSRPYGVYASKTSVKNSRWGI